MKIIVEYDENGVDDCNFTPLKIDRAEYVDGYRVMLVFNDGKKNVVDVGEFLKRRPHPQYNKYREVKNFKKFKIENGNIVWGKDWDLIFHLDELYKGKIKI